MLRVAYFIAAPTAVGPHMACMRSEHDRLSPEHTQFLALLAMHLQLETAEKHVRGCSKGKAQNDTNVSAGSRNGCGYWSMKPCLSHRQNASCRADTKRHRTRPTMRQSTRVVPGVKVVADAYSAKKSLVASEPPAKEQVFLYDNREVYDCPVPDDASQITENAGKAVAREDSQ
jgi:hypothetical protein